MVAAADSPHGGASSAGGSPARLKTTAHKLRIAFRADAQVAHERAAGLFWRTPYGRMAAEIPV